jgi:hypothetical protein
MEVDKGKIKIDISWEFVMKFLGIEGVRGFKKSSRR